MNKAEKLFQTEIENENNRYSTLSNNEEKSNYHHKKSKSLNRLYSSIPKDPNRFNVVKKIQNIKLMARNNNSNDPYKIYKSKVAFDKNNIDFVFEPRRQIIEYKKRKANKLTDKDGSLSKFLLENKLIGINNYMISLLKSESDRLIYKENENNKKIENMELKNKENNEKFNTIVEKQNKALETIENALHNLHQKIIEFEEEAREKKIIEKSIDEQIQKILKNLEELRTYGKFVSKVIQRDHNNFDNKIFSKKNNNNNNLYNSSNTFDFRDLTSNAIDNYKFVIERNKEDEKELNELLEDPNTMLIKFNEIEDRILRFLNERIIDENQKRNDKKEIDNIKKEMYIRYNFLQREFDSLTELFQNESNNLPIMRKICGIEDTKGASELIEEIYYDMCYNDEYNFKKNKLMKITDIIHDCIHRIYLKEDEINNHINTLEKFENENSNLFYQVINDRKLENKEEKLIEQKKLLEKVQEQKRIKSEQKLKKIVIKSRKTEAPFRSFRQNYQNNQEIVTPQPIINPPKIHLGHHRHSMSHNNEFEMIIY